jgi:hypothetical protein
MLALGSLQTHCAQAAPDAVFQTFPSHAGIGQSGTWSSLQYPGTLVWSIVGNCAVRDSIELEDGSTVILGNCIMHRLEEAGQPTYNGPIIARIDVTGHVLWAKRFNLQGLDRLEKVQIGPNGTLLAWGMWPRCKSNNLCIRPILLTFDLNGNLKAAKSLQHRTEVKSEYLTDAAITEQGDLVGMSGSDIWKLDKDGSIEWVRDDQPAGESNINLFLAVGNGTIFTVNQFVPKGDNYRRNIVIARDYSGRVLWKRMLLAGPSDEIAAVTIDKNGMLILVGSTIRMGPHLEDKVYPRTGWIVKMTTTGAIQQSATVDPRYGYLLAGVSDSPRGLILRGIMPGSKPSLMFEDSSLKCLAYWPIPLNNMHFDIESSTSPIEIWFEDIEVPILEFPLVAQQISAKLEQSCEGTIVPP